MYASTLLSALLVATASASGGGSEPYEWAGIFDTPDNVYFWQAEKVEGDYADPAMKIVLLPATATTDAAFDGYESDGETAIELASCTTVSAGGTMTPAANKCYSLDFDKTSHSSVFKIDTTGVAHLAIYAEHVPTEFERNSHYLKDIKGEDIEPIHERPEKAPLPKPWGTVIGAAIIVNVVTIIGVIFIVPFFSKLRENYPGVLSICVNAFAAGALLSAAFYLMMYEATHLIKPEGSTEPQQIAWWGSAVMLGFSTAYFIDLFASFFTKNGPSATPTSPSDTATSTDDTNTKNVGNGLKIVEQAKQQDPGRQTRVLAGVLVGDFMHNLVDGFFIGFGFMACGDTFGWTITGATVAHEIGQEVADYLVLTDIRQGGLKWWKALLLNFVSGTSVVLGALIILAQGAEDNFSLGMLLAYGGGVYLQIGAGECMPRAAEIARSPILRIVALTLFFIGAAAIALVLLNHEHCAPDGGHAH